MCSKDKFKGAFLAFFHSLLYAIQECLLIAVCCGVSNKVLSVSIIVILSVSIIVSYKINSSVIGSRHTLGGLNTKKAYEKRTCS